ncbi:ankyrin repeat-containing domain protein [Bipolaris maydis]|nr:ankyrin repeat-containing domain protein [Bipolaris maydis]
MVGLSHQDIVECDDLHVIEPWPLHDFDLPLFKAAYRGDDAQVTFLVASGVDVNARSKCNLTPLQLAIHGDQADTVRTLLSAGADATIQEEIEPVSMLHVDAINRAAWLGARHTLEALINFGIKIPCSALRLAASLNRVDCMRTIADKLGQHDFSDVSKLEGWSIALDRAAVCWHDEAVELALVHVSRFLADSDSEGRSCLSSALASAAREDEGIDQCRWYGSRPGRRLRIMQSLIAAGADVNWEEPEEWQSEHRAAPGLNVFWIVLDDNLASPKDETLLLLSSGLQLEKERPDNGRTPLFGLVSEQQHDTSLAEAFINAGAKATTKDADLDTPLHFAGNRCFAELLFKFGADLFAKDHDGFMPLHMACRDRRLDVAEFLLLKGAAVDATTTTKQWTPLLLATYPRRNDTDTERHEKLVKLLLSHGANVQATTSDGQTVLHNAAHAGNLDLVKYVVEHGVNVNAITSNGETALHLVGHYLSPFAPQIAQRLAITHFLLENGAEINARDQTGSTPLHASWSCAHHFSHSPDMFSLFLKKGADRLATDGQMRTPIDLIDRERWMLDEDGFKWFYRETHSVSTKMNPSHPNIMPLYVFEL